MDRPRRRGPDAEVRADTPEIDSAVPDGSIAEDRPEREGRIARRAYERFEARGREHGRDVEDWLESEREFENDRTK
jgi:hypothetical protein